MIVRPLSLKGVNEIIPLRLEDSRGFFSETYNGHTLKAAGLELAFVQDNHSYSARRGTLRGLHYQLPPRAQAKLVRVARGAILDVAVDIRRSSASFGKWVALELSAAKWNQILIPQGFAHGFVTLTDEAEVIYKVTDTYSPAHDRAIRFDDPQIGINWPFPAAELLLLDKDRKAPSLSEATVFE